MGTSVSNASRLGSTILQALEGAVAQIGLEKGFSVVEGIAKPILFSKAWGEKLEETVSLLKPTIDDYIEKSTVSDPEHRREHFNDFQAGLQRALDIVRDSDQIHILDIKAKYDYGNKIQEFNQEIKDFIGIQGAPNLALDLQKLIAEVRNLGRRFELIERLTLQKVNLFTQLVPDTPKEVVALYKPIIDVKQILMNNDVSIVGIGGMGGSGKTTLATALCNNAEVQASFQKNIPFITVSQHQTENGVLEILEIMWDHFIGDDRPRFRSIEDARTQLQNNLKRIAETTHRQTLVVLDDVWSKSNVKNFLFEVEGYKTIITTRDKSIIPHIDGTRLYDMPVLEDADALSLLCFWAFGQTSIPAIANEDLVKQVAAECKGLPLALKVIGSSLHSKPRPVWKIAKEKLSRAEPITEEHEYDLLRHLKTSIDILNDKERQCFLDLGAFPKGKKFSVNALLDIWVYVRGMEWHEAFDVLLESAS